MTERLDMMQQQPLGMMQQQNSMMQQRMEPAAVSVVLAEPVNEEKKQPKASSVGTPSQYCENCGRSLAHENKFCTGCGTRVSIMASPPSAPPMSMLMEHQQAAHTPPGTSGGFHAQAQAPQHVERYPDHYGHCFVRLCQEFPEKSRAEVMECMAKHGKPGAWNAEAGENTSRELQSITGHPPIFKPPQPIDPHPGLDFVPASTFQGRISPAHCHQYRQGVIGPRPRGPAGMPVGMLGDEEPEVYDAAIGLSETPNARPAAAPGQPPVLGLGSPLLGTQQSPAPKAGGIIPKIVCAVAVIAAFASSIVLFTRLYEKKVAKLGNRGTCQVAKCPMVFVVGGCSACSNSPSGEQWQPALGALESYNPTTAAWNTTFPPLPIPRAMLGLGAVADQIYAIGGIEGGNATSKCTGSSPECQVPGIPSARIDRYDPATRKWGPLLQGDGSEAALKAPTWGMAVATRPKGVYLIGGFTTTGAQPPKLGVPTTAVWYLPVSPNAGVGPVAAKPMVAKGKPSNRAFATGGLVQIDACTFKPHADTCHSQPPELEDVLIVTGGMGTDAAAMKSTIAFFPLNESWVDRGDMPTARVGAASAVVRSPTTGAQSMYVIGGSGDTKAILNTVPTVDVYDPSTNSWKASVASMPRALTHFGAVSVGSKLLLVDGIDRKLHTGAVDVSGEVFALDTAERKGSTKPAFSQIKIQASPLGDPPVHRADMGVAVLTTGPCLKCERDQCCCDTACKTRTVKCCEKCHPRLLLQPTQPSQP